MHYTYICENRIKFDCKMKITFLFLRKFESEIENKLPFSNIHKKRITFVCKVFIAMEEKKKNRQQIIDTYY